MFNNNNTLIEDLMNKNLLKYLDNKLHRLCQADLDDNYLSDNLSKNKFEKDCLDHLRNQLKADEASALFVTNPFIKPLQPVLDIITIDGKHYWSDEIDCQEGY